MQATTTNRKATTTMNTNRKQQGTICIHLREVSRYPSSVAHLAQSMLVTVEHRPGIETPELSEYARRIFSFAKSRGLVVRIEKLSNGSILVRGAGSK